MSGIIRLARCPECDSLSDVTEYEGMQVECWGGVWGHGQRFMDIGYYQYLGEDPPDAEPAEPAQPSHISVSPGKDYTLAVDFIPKPVEHDEDCQLCLPVECEHGIPADQACAMCDQLSIYDNAIFDPEDITVYKDQSGRTVGIGFTPLPNEWPDDYDTEELINPEEPGDSND